MERFFRTVRDQFLVEVPDTAAAELAATGTSHTAALLELNTKFTAWVETVYHHREHSETGQTPLRRWSDGWDASPRPPAVPSPDLLTEAFKWTGTRTVTVSLHGNTYQVDQALAGRKVELVFDPFDLARIEVRHAGRSHGPALPHTIARHTHPKARPEAPEPAPPPPTGIDYMSLVADAHQAQLAVDRRISIGSLYPDPAAPPGQLPGQSTIDDVLGAAGADGAVAE